MDATRPQTRIVDSWTLTPIWGKNDLTVVISKVVVTKQAQKDLRSTPVQVQAKFRMWIDSVERVGLEETRKVAGFHDEPLKGKLEGARSIRLNDAYRAYYQIKADTVELVEFVSVTRVDKHLYRK